MLGGAEFAYRVFADSQDALVVLEGDLDLATSPEAEAAISLLIERGMHVAVDLRGLRFLDSFGLRMLTFLEERARQHRADVRVLAAGNERVERVVSLCGLEQILRWSQDTSGEAAVSLRDEANAVAVIATDRDGLVVRWNVDAEHLYGWTAQEAVGRPITGVTVTAHTSELGQDIMNTVRLMGRWTGEFRVACKDRPPVPARVHLAVVEDAHGEMGGLVGLSVAPGHPAWATLDGAAAAEPGLPSAAQTEADHAGLERVLDPRFRAHGEEGSGA